MLDIEALYRRHADELRDALRRDFGSSVPDVLIDDACSQAWEIALRKRSKLRGDGNPLGWVYKVAYRQVLGLLRRQHREVACDVIERADNRTSPELALLALDAKDALSRLTPKQRLALSLRLHGYSYSESAEVTGKTYTWVNRQNREARAALRKLIND
jgi:RNA polymerase sigma factor (sigma-70 family)